MATAAMGTRFEVVIALGLSVGQAFGPADLRAIGELALAEIDDWHARLSRFAPDSWVSHVNRTAATEPVRCDDEVWALLSDARAVWVASDGAFDITRGQGEALALDPERRTVAFSRPGVAIDLGGIGKGHAIDCCARLLRSHGVGSAFVHGGTSSGAGIGVDADGMPWRVAVPGESQALLVTDRAFSLSDAAGQTRPHIVDRQGADVVAGRVAVVGPSARMADAWSTALVVLGRVPAAFPADYEVRMY